jgi:Zn-dependent protease
MFRSWKIGSLFGIPLYVHPTFFLLPLFALANLPQVAELSFPVLHLVVLSVVFALYGCVILHEFGHALTARAFGIRTLDISLYPIGGVARLERMAEVPRQELLIALAGPAVNVVIAALLTPFVLAAPFLDVGWLPVAAFLTWLWGGNIVLVLFNMLPAFPMDGGRVLRSILAMSLGQLRATEIASGVGFAVASLMACLVLLGVPGFHNPFLLVIAVFVVFVGRMELASVRNRAAQQRDAYLDPERRGFSGVLWDAHYRVFVRWHEGRPVGCFWGRAE